MARFTKAEETAWDSPAETDTHQDARQPYARREKAFGPNITSERSRESLAEDYQWGFDVVNWVGRTRRESEPRDRWLMYGDQALAAAREEQRRIKAEIKPHVERYRKITGNKR